MNALNHDPTTIDQAAYVKHWLQYRTLSEERFIAAVAAEYDYIQRVHKLALERAWRPMETAPLNGDEIIVLFDSATVDIVRLCWWNNGDEDQNGGEADAEAVGWWSYIHSVTQVKIYKMTPLGWMPMPPRPAKP